MRILLTGACGRLGRAIRKLGEDEHTFTLVDVNPAIESEGGIHANVSDYQAMMRAGENCDAIIHTAAMHGGMLGKASNEQFINNNLNSAEALFQTALQHGIRRLVMSSTMEILVGNDWKAYGTAVLAETLPPRPDWIYPVTKQMIEQLGSFYARHHNLEVVSLRYMGFGNLAIEDLELALLARFLHTDDVARANLLSATCSGLTDEMFHIGPDTPLTQKDINDAFSDPWMVLERYWPGCGDILKANGLEPKTHHFSPVTRIDRAKFRLGWQPRVTFSHFLHMLGWQNPTEQQTITP